MQEFSSDNDAKIYILLSKLLSIACENILPGIYNRKAVKMCFNWWSRIKKSANQEKIISMATNKQFLTFIMNIYLHHTQLNKMKGCINKKHSCRFCNNHRARELLLVLVPYHGA